MASWTLIRGLMERVRKAPHRRLTLPCLLGLDSPDLPPCCRREYEQCQATWASGIGPLYITIPADPGAILRHTRRVKLFRQVAPHAN